MPANRDLKSSLLQWKHSQTPTTVAELITFSVNFYWLHTHVMAFNWVSCKKCKAIFLSFGEGPLWVGTNVWCDIDTDRLSSNHCKNHFQTQRLRFSYYSPLGLKQIMISKVIFRCWENSQNNHPFSDWKVLYCYSEFKSEKKNSIVKAFHALIL